MVRFPFAIASPTVSFSGVDMNWTGKGEKVMGGQRKEFADEEIVYKKPLALFSQKPMTGYYRDGYCRTGAEDGGNHAVAGSLSFSFLFSLPLLFIWLTCCGNSGRDGRIPRLLGLERERSEENRPHGRV